MSQEAQLFNQNLSKWNTKRAANVSHMFILAKSFNGDVSSWNVSNVQDFRGMFHHALSFYRDLSQWNTSNATDVRCMFHRTERFNSDILNWNISKVKSFRDMFGAGNDPNCMMSFNQDLVDWLHMALSEPCLKVSNSENCLNSLSNFHQL
jgi:surface protein